jgi:hypothetical protein
MHAASSGAIVARPGLVILRRNEGQSVFLN